MAEIEDLTVVRTKGGSPSVLILDNQIGDGWPDPIEVQGNAKCLLCHGSVTNALICQECHDIILTLRTGDNLSTLKKLLVAFQDPVFRLVLDAVTSDLASDILMQRLVEPDD